MHHATTTQSGVGVITATSSPVFEMAQWPRNGREKSPSLDAGTHRVSERGRPKSAWLLAAARTSCGGCAAEDPQRAEDTFFYRDGETSDYEEETKGAACLTQMLHVWKICIHWGG